MQRRPVAPHLHPASAEAVGPNILQWVAQGAERLQQLRAQRAAEQESASAFRRPSAGPGSDSDQRFPFVQLFQTLGEACPTRVVESPNHCTVELEIPMGLQLGTPKIEDVHPATGTFKVTAELLKPRSAQQKLSPDPLDGDPMTDFLKSLGLNVHLQHEGLGAAFTRTLHLPPSVYAVEGARPFLEDGALRVYVPKRQLAQQPDARPPSPGPLAPAPKVETAAEAQPPSGTRKPFASSRSPWSPEAPATQSQPTRQPPSPTTNPVDERVARRSDALASWPPKVSMIADDAKQTVYEVRLPAGVGAGDLSIDFDASTHKLCVEVRQAHKVVTPCSEEVQNFSFKRWLDVDPAIDDAALIETDFAAAEGRGSDGTLRIQMTKPQPKSVGKQAVRIPIGKKPEGNSPR